MCGVRKAAGDDGKKGRRVGDMGGGGVDCDGGSHGSPQSDVAGGMDNARNEQLLINAAPNLMSEHLC
jgi:hypothetical protein